MKKILFLVFLLVGVTLSAEVKDKFKINLGTMAVINYETEVQLSRKGGVVSGKLNTKDQLGMENDTNVFRLDGYYRFTDTHSIDFSYFSVNSNGVRVINQEIPDWGENNNTIDAGARVDSYLNMDIYKINYAYSFYHNKDVELALSAGLHITTIGFGLGATGSIDGVADSSMTTGSTVTVPLPVFGFKGEYTVIDKTLFVQYRSDYFYLSMDGFKGSFVSSTLNLEYRFLENYGAGVGLNVNNLELKADDGNVELDVMNNLTGAMFYLTYVY